MGSEASRDSRRGIAFAAALAVNIVLTGVVTLWSRIRQSPDHPAIAGIWVVIPRVPAPEPLLPLPRLSVSPSIGSIHLDLPQIPSESPAPSEHPPAIDWDKQAKQAAAAIASPAEVHEFGSPKKKEPEGGKPPPPPTHKAGESYRNTFGDQIYWVNERCYLVSPNQPLGLPDVLARMQITRGACIDPGPPPGQLFKDLKPDYLKH